MKDILESIEEYFLAASNGEIYDYIISHVEKALIEKALERCGGNQIAAAKILSLNRNTLHTKLKKLNINIINFKK
ncbi:MAG: helix-turn-helix domain-containing protein [Candidatus Omnitrophota bacterium]